VRRASPPAGEQERREQLAEAAAWIAVPCLHTAVTTAAGFAALATSRIALIRDFGLLAAVGILLAWAISLATITALASLADLRSPASDREPRIAGALAAFARTLPRRRPAIIAGFALAVAILGLGITRVRADTLTIGILPEGSRIRLDSDWVERRLGSYTPLEFVVRTPGATPDPAFAARLAAWREEVARIPGVERTFTAADLGMLGFGMLRAYLADGGAELRVTAFVPMTTSRTFTTLAELGEGAGAAIFGDSTVVRASGYLPLYSRITDYVVQSTLWGMGSAFLLVFGFLWLLARDWRTVLAAIPSNVVPIILVFGVMGWAGIPLDIATATVGAIVLGIVVDDTIHVLHRYRQARLAGAGVAAASETTVREAGPSIVLTSVVVGAGFAVMIAASTTGIAYFGLVATLAVVGALIADLVLLPVLLR
jgi:predicted RND superfamily exporter protein